MAREIPDTSAVPWRSTGWNDDRNVIQMLDILVGRGDVAVSSREGRERVFDLAERVYPDEPAMSTEDATAERDRRRLAALGIARARTTAVPIEVHHVGEAGEPAVIDGVKGQWRVDPAYLGQSLRGRTALLSPLDRLVFDRKRAEAIFEYEYALEMYKPVAKRQWGYWAMPILHEEWLIGKLDARADRASGRFVVETVHEDVPFTSEVRAAVDAEIDALAVWLGLEVEREG